MNPARFQCVGLAVGIRRLLFGKQSVSGLQQPRNTDDGNIRPVIFDTFHEASCFQNLKLSSIKMDARFTTSSQILKLVGSHEISKITLKISEIRRTKMVKRLSLFYSNKTVQSAVELKNRYVLRLFFFLKATSFHVYLL